FLASADPAALIAAQLSPAASVHLPAVLLCAAQSLQRYGAVGAVRAGVRTAPNCHRWASTNLGQTAVAIQIDESSAEFRATDRTRQITRQHLLQKGAP